MKRLLLSVCAVVSCSLALGLGSVVAATPAGHGATVTVAGSDLGRILVDGRGRTLYLFEKDKHGKSACNGQCASFWPPLIASRMPLATGGARQLLLGTTKRADGRLQVTYDHHPLYTFVQDTAKGQTRGEEVSAFGAKWYALAPAGGKVERPADAHSSSGSDDAPGGYSY